MKQLVVLSGKGGTGKTTVCSALIKLHNVKAFGDCDVDAPNLHLLFGKDEASKDTDYYGMQKAFIDQDSCIGCNRCLNKCKFNAIERLDCTCKINETYCEGCGVCSYVCPVGAVSFKDSLAGELKLYKDSVKTFSTAKLKMGSGTSGKLVTEVKKQLRENTNESFSIVDGSPGIGCPVIATLSGASMVLIVAEPSISGISDMKRIVKTARNFGVKTFVCVNKYDINEEKTKEIEQYAINNGLIFVGKIPYDKEAVNAINDAKSIIDIKSKSGMAISKIYDIIKENF